ncbi:MAG: hypothetical protein H6862_03455 [Rhodospirillales bacterium]|nr:hypothetical protein [Rhodospirillales bacterium]
MGMAGQAFGEAGGSCFSSRIKESIKAGEGVARDLCEPVRGNADPDLLAVLRQTFQFFLKGAISLHRKGRRADFWGRPSLEERQANFCAQLMQVSAVVAMARFLEETGVGNRIDWQSVAQAIPSEIIPGKSITPCVARQYTAVFARSVGPDRVLVDALPEIISEEAGLSSCFRALGLPEQPDPFVQGRRMHRRTARPEKIPVFVAA